MEKLACIGFLAQCFQPVLAHDTVLPPIRGNAVLVGTVDTECTGALDKVVTYRSIWIEAVAQVVLQKGIEGEFVVGEIRLQKVSHPATSAPEALRESEVS